MTEQALVDLKFRREVLPPTSAHDELITYYYTYELSDSLTIMSNFNNEVVNGEWSIEGYDWGNDLNVRSSKDSSYLIKVIERNRPLEEEKV